jgi:hypothetical protein
MNWMSRIAWKVVGFDPKTQMVFSGADNRVRRIIRIGQPLDWPKPGAWMSLDRKYVIDHYAVHEFNALLELSFDPETLSAGNLTDRQTEFVVECAQVVSMVILIEL